MSAKRSRPRLWLCLGISLAVVFAAVLGLGAFARGPWVFSVPQGFVPPEVDPASLRATVERLCGPLGPRVYAPPLHLDRVADWLTQRIRDAGYPVEEQRYRLPEGEYRNLVVRVPGSDPSLAPVIVGAHYDSYGDFPAADDNASGVAVLLELIRTLPPEPLPRTRIFAFFPNEEPPFFSSEEMGSHHFARSFLDAELDVELMVALDCIGYYSDEPGSQRYPLQAFRLFYPSRGDFLAVIGDLDSGSSIERAKRGLRTAGSIPVLSFRGPSGMPGILWSDHYWFRQFDYPAVLVSDTAFHRSPHYHRRSDTPETLNYERMADAVQALHGLLHHVAGE